MLANTTPVTLETLLDAVAGRLAQGQRFVTITCTDTGPAFDLLYHFDRDYALTHLRLNLPKAVALHSIAGICPAALLVENEIKDLFGLAVSGLPVDYESRFILSEGAGASPFRKPTPIEVN